MAFVIKNVVAINRAIRCESLELERYFIEEITEFLEELKRLTVLRKRETITKRETYFVRKDEFSLCTSANTDTLEAALRELGGTIAIHTQDVKALLTNKR